MNCLIASGPVIIEKNKVLLAKHGHDNFWKFIGGKVESSDLKKKDPLQYTCCREAKEELGVDLDIIKPLKPMLIKKPGSPKTVILLIHFLAKKTNKIKPGKDIIDWNWFNINKLPSDCAPNIRPVVKQYLETKKL